MKPLVYIVYYSTFGHVYKLAKAEEDGLLEAHCAVKLYQVEETLSDEILERMQAPLKQNVPIIKARDLIDANGILFGMPTRFGSIPAQMKTLFDACGSMWAKQELIGKPVGTFFSTGVLGGGQETTALSCLPVFTHLGMIYVPFGYYDNELTNLNEIHGGSPWGAGTLADNDQRRNVTNLEIRLARKQGLHFGQFMHRLKF